MTRASRTVWQERVERWRRSGQSAQEFAAAMGFNAWTLRKWSDRLRRERDAGPSVRVEKLAPGQAARGVRLSKSAVPPLSFVEVLADSASASAPESRFEIVLRSGVIVRIPARFEPQALERVLAAVQRR